MVKSYLDKYFNRLNKEVYEQKGMEWYIVPNHYWLELRIISARTNTSQNIDSNNNSIKFGEITKNDRSPMVSSKFGPMQEEVNLNKENINQEPLQFYENNKNEEEYDIERDGVYHEESMNEDESRPMNTDYMNPNDVKQIFQNDFNNFHEDLSKDAIEMHHEDIELPQERKYTEPYDINTKTGLQSSKIMTSNDIERDIEREIDNEIEELNLFK